MKLMSRCSRHAWVDEMGICTVMSLKGYATNSKAIASYTQTVTQLDTKLAFLKIASWKQLCVVMINIQYSCVVATSFVHRADTWGLKLYDNLWLTLIIALTSMVNT